MSRTVPHDDPGSARNEMRTERADYVIQVGGDIGALNIGEHRPVKVPRSEMPPARSRFVNQVRLLDFLQSVLPAPEDETRLVVLTGPPGIGKSATVRQFAHRNRGRFSNTFYVDCAGLTGQMGTSAILARFLRSLGISDRHMPPTVDEMSGEFRSLTADEPVLVVLENVAETPHVRAAMPNARGNMVLATTADSHDDLDDLGVDPGGVFIEMKRFTENSAIELLGVICGTERIAAEAAAARSLAGLCAGLPLAITLWGTGLTRSRGLTIEQLVAELSGDNRGPVATKGERAVSRAYSFQYDHVTASAQRLYRLLGALPLPDVSAEAAAVVTGHDTGTTRRLLTELRSADLLEEREDGRYEFHRLAREHAAKLARHDPPGEHEDALHALTRWFLVGAAYADRAIMGKDRARVANHEALLAGHEDPFTRQDEAARKAAADAWLDSERASMVPLVKAAREHGWDEEAWQLAEALTGGFYYDHRLLGDWLAVTGEGIRAARRCGNEQAEARLLLSASRAHADRGDADLVRDAVEAAMDIAGRGTDPVLLASAHEFRGRYLEGLDPQRALAEYDLSRDLNLRAGQRRGAALAAFFAARLRAESAQPAAPGELERALRDLRESAGTFRSLGDGRMTGRTLIAAGAVEDRLGRDRDATATLKEAVTRLGDAHYAAEALEKLADIAGRSGDPAAAGDHLRAALRIYEKAGHPRARVITERLRSHRSP